jgi:3,4-dihydroxy 2-butanone 4-phosphate synthase/GTP cyclohydrolase II
VHLALVRGRIDGTQPTLVRVHVHESLADVVGVTWPSLGWPLRSAMQRIAEEGSGVVLILREREDPRRLVERVQQGNIEPAAPAEDVSDLRKYGVGAQMLRDLGVTRMRVLSAPKRMHALSGFGLEVVEYVDE